VPERIPSTLLRWGALCLPEYEKRDLYGRRDYLRMEIERELSAEEGEIHWMGLYELKTALLETEAAIAFHVPLFPDLPAERYGGD
jgi:hypothetical protein